MSINQLLFQRPAMVSSVVAYDNATTSLSRSDFAHTCSGLNRYLTVTTLTSWDNLPTAITYNGVPLTQIHSITDNNLNTTLWALVNPDAGSNTISSTWSGGAGWMTVGAVSFSNVNQTTPSANWATDSNPSSDPQTVAATSTASDFVLSSIQDYSGAPFTNTGTNMTTQASAVSGGSLVITQPGNNGNPSWTAGGVQTWVATAITIKPV